MTMVLDSKKKLLITIFHFNEGPILYSLQALNIEEELGAAFGGKSGGRQRERRRSSHPVNLLHLYRDKYPVGMGFIFIESTNKLYFTGGQFNKNGVIYSSKKVFCVDLTPLVTQNHASISISSTSSSSFSFTTSSSSSSSSIEKSFVSMLSVSEAPSMHIGKCNPILIDACEKIFVLASACGTYINPKCKSISDFYCDPNPNSFGPPPFENTQHMTQVILWDNPENLFEVFDPQSHKWSVLPDPSPDYYSASFFPTVIVGQAVINGTILLCDRSCNVLAYHIDNAHWLYFDSHTSTKSLYPEFYHFQLPHMIKNGIQGKGVVVDGEILFVFNRRNGMSAYDLESSNSYSKSDSFSFIQVDDSKFSYRDKYDFPGGLFLSGVHLLNLGQGSLCALSCDYGRKLHSETPGDVRLTFFKVSEEPYSFGTSFWRANVKDSFVIEDMNTQLGSMMYCFALEDQTSVDMKLVERPACSNRYSLLSTLRKTMWEKGHVVAFASIIGLGVLLAVAC